ncbi:hypothetical protein [Marinomonas sp.]
MFEDKKISAPNMLNTAVLFLVFNRLDTTKQVFEAIREVKPPRIYIAADGARKNKVGEAEVVQSVRDYVCQSVDWDCDVKTLFREENLGCKYAVSSAITWFFENEKQGIILEDDVVPNQDFFYFMENCLEKYKNDNRIMMVTGTNYLGDSSLEAPYSFSEHMTIWGWGTWRRAWSLYDVDMAKWNTSHTKDFFKRKYFSSYIWKHFRNTFDMLETSYMDTWDIQWVFCCLYHHGLCILPKVNMISNVGVEGTHGVGATDSHFIKKESLKSSAYIDFYPDVHVNYKYDISLHELKSRKSVRRESVVRLLRFLKVYNKVRALKRLFK